MADDIMPDRNLPDRNVPDRGATDRNVSGRNTSDRDPPDRIASDGGRTANDRRVFFPNFATVQTALESAQIGVWFLDSISNTVTWSSNFEALHGLAAGSLQGGYADFLGNIRDDDRASVDAALQQALRAQSGFRARCRAPRRDGHDDVWLEVSGTAVGDNDASAGMIGLCYEVTERVNLENEWRSRAKQQESLAQFGERALAERDIEQLLNDAVSTVAVTLAVDFVKVLELLPGGGELLLRAGFGWKSDLLGTVLTTNEPHSFNRFTLDSSVPVVIADFATEVRFTVPRYLRDHDCTSGVNVTIAGRDGRAFGILGVYTKGKRQFSAQDTSFLAAIGNLLAGAIQRGQLEERNELMIRDMRHRSGNLFSQLLALFSQTAKTSKSIPDLTGKYQARVLAMANAHRLIAEGGWQSIPIIELLEVVLGPYIDRATFDGPNIDLEPDPVFNLSAALHELAANAIKHGSLSRPKGQLELHWTVDHTPRGMTMTLDWTEKNGPPTRRPRRVGFGSRLIDLVIVRQLNGEVTRTFARKGLTVKMLVPLTHERWPSPAKAAPGDAHANA
jgi:PAS domain S-box-containing protein